MYKSDSIVRVALLGLLGAGLAAASTVTQIVEVDQGGGQIALFGLNGSTWDLKWTVTGYPAWTLYSAVFDSAGDIYVQDEFGGKIYKFDSAGNHLAAGDINVPALPVGGMIFLPDGSMVTGTGSGFCVLSGPLAGCGTISSANPAAHGLATDGTNIYVTDNSGFLYEYSYGGSGWTQQQAVDMSGPTGFSNHTRGLAIYGGVLYVAHSDFSSVYQCTIGSGLTCPNFKDAGNPPTAYLSGLDYPNDIAFDSNGNLYIAEFSNDASNGRVDIYDLSKTLTGSVGSGSGLAHLSGLALREGDSGVPEPATTAVLGGGLVLLGLLRRYRRG